VVGRLIELLRDTVESEVDPKNWTVE
jgi:hypothetical protein